MLFILLARLTDDGLLACLDNPDAFAEACNAVDVPGTQLLARYATLGQYDFVVHVEAVGVQQMSRLSVVLGANARVHIESMPTTAAQLLAEHPEGSVREEATRVSG